MSRSKNATRNISWGIVNKCIGTLMPFLTRTVLIYKLGNEYIGLNSLFTSILGLLSLSELGIGTALIFSMYEPLEKNNTEKVCALMNLYKKCYSIIGFIVAAIGLILLPFLNIFIAGDVPANLNVYVLYIIYLINTVLSYWLFAYKKSLIIACQRVDIQSNVNTFILIFQNTLQFVLVLIFSNYYFYVLTLPLCTIIENIIISYIADKKYPQYRPMGSIKIKELSNIKKNIVGLLFQRIGNVVLSSADSIVISSFLGLSILGTYNNYFYVITALFGFSAIIQTSLKPIVGNSIVSETHKKNLNDFQKINFLYIWIISWATSALLCLYQPFIEIWVGKDSVLPFSIVILLVIYFFTYKWGDMLFVYQEAAGLWWKTRYVPIAAAALNLIINIILVNTIGLAGIPLSTIISVVLIYDLGYAKILFNEYFGRKYFKSFALQQIKYLTVTVVTCIITYASCLIVSADVVGTLIARICICIIVPNLLLLIVYHRNKHFAGISLDIKNKLLSKRGKL